MKKIIKALLVAALAAVLVFPAAACGGNNGGSNGGGNNVAAELGTGAEEIVGTWKMSFDETKLTDETKAYATMYKSLIEGINMTAQFNSDGTVNVEVDLSSMAGMLGSVVSVPTETQKGTGKWKREGDKVIISEVTGGMTLDPTAVGTSTASGESSGKFVLKDGKLVMDGQEMFPFVKQ